MVMWPYTIRLLSSMPTCRACLSYHVPGSRIPLVPGAYCCNRLAHWGVRMSTRWVRHWIFVEDLLLPRRVVAVGTITLVGSWLLYPTIHWGNVSWSFEWTPLLHFEDDNLVLPIPVSSCIRHGWQFSLHWTPHCLRCAFEEWCPPTSGATSWRVILL